MKCYDFAERKLFAHGHAPSVAAVGEIIAERIPGFIKMEQAQLSDDRNGIDYWIYRKDNKPLTVDLKNRGEDWSVKGKDDLALETWSVTPIDGYNGIPGWTRDPAKQCDFILWYWQDTGRFCLLPFVPLCWVFMRYWQWWAFSYGTKPQTSKKDGKTWQSECVYVPRQVVAEKLEAWANGKKGA